MMRCVVLPDNVVEEADGEDHDTDGNDLDTSCQPGLTLSLCILIRVSLKQTETSLSTLSYHTTGYPNNGGSIPLFILNLLDPNYILYRSFTKVIHKLTLKTPFIITNLRNG